MKQFVVRLYLPSNITVSLPRELGGKKKIQNDLVDNTRQEGA